TTTPPLRLYYCRLGNHPDLHPFPPRRSSDLRSGRTVRCHRDKRAGVRAAAGAVGAQHEGGTWIMTHGKYSDPEEIKRLLGSLPRSEEHTSELQFSLVCRLLLDKKETTLRLEA